MPHMYFNAQDKCVCFECVCVLPGRQLLVLQTTCCSRGPTQEAPPGSGSCSTVLFRIDSPPPQEALQSLQCDHSLNKHPAGETQVENYIKDV